MNLLTPDPGLLFWMLISFGIAFFILAKYGFPIITNMVEKRALYIEESLKAANLANEQLASIQEQKKQILSEANAEQARILKDADDARKKMIEDAKNEAIAEGKKEMDAMRAQIELEQKMAINEIKREVAKISVDIAEKILRENLETTTSQMSLIDKLVDEAMISKS